MASILLIAGIIIAIKIAEEHDKKKNLGLDTPSPTITVTDEYSPETHLHLERPHSSKRELLTRRYWHERRQSRHRAVSESGSGSGSESESGRSVEGDGDVAERARDEAPPAYMGPPAYHELPAMDSRDDLVGDRTEATPRQLEKSG
ncbi:hypothetical protein BJX70DRAFT_383833 [Aspergillus crustosus]